MPTDQSGSNIGSCPKHSFLKNVAEHHYLTRRARMLLKAATNEDSGRVIAVQTVAEGSNKIAVVFAEKGFATAKAASYVSYRSIVALRARSANRGAFEQTELELSDGSRLLIDSGNARREPTLFFLLGHLLRQTDIAILRAISDY